MIARATIVSPIDGRGEPEPQPGQHPGTRQLFTLQQTDVVYAVLNGAGGQVIGAVTGGSAQISSTDNASPKANGKIAAVLDQVSGATNFIINCCCRIRRAFHAAWSFRDQRKTTRGMLIPRRRSLTTRARGDCAERKQIKLFR